MHHLREFVRYLYFCITIYKSEMENIKEIIKKNGILLKTGLWMAVLNAVLLNLISYHYLAVTYPTENIGETIYLYAFSISHFFFLSLIPYLIAFLPVSYFSKKRATATCMVSSAILYGIFLVYILLDSYIFFLYRFHFNSTVTEQLLGPGAGQVFELSTGMWIAAIVIIALLFLFQVFLFKMGQKLAKRIRFKKQIVLVASILGIYACCQLVHAVAAAKNEKTITRCDRYFPLLATLGGEAPFAGEMNLRGHQYNYPKQAIKGTGSGKNIIMIVLDSWTYNSMDSAYCPNICKFAKRCNQFSHHYSGGNCTRNGVFSMFYGLPGTYWYDFMEQQISPVLIDELKKEKYDIRLYPSASMQNPAFDKNVFVKEAKQCGATEGSKAWERDRNLAQNFIAGIKENKSKNPIFSLLFFDSLHSMILPDSSEYKAPFQPTWEAPLYLEVNNSTEPTPFYNLYKNMLYYLDGYFAEVIKALEEEGMMENSVIIVTGDHGQEFNENKKNFWGHNGNFSPEQVQVPLLYYTTGRQPATYTHWTSHFDLAATLMQDVLGVTNDVSDYTVGRSLFDTTKRDYMVCDGYNGMAITEENGNITDLFYDGNYQITDRHLNHLTNQPLDTNRVNQVLRTIESFYQH